MFIAVADKIKYDKNSLQYWNSFEISTTSSLLFPTQFLPSPSSSSLPLHLPSYSHFLFFSVPLPLLFALLSLLRRFLSHLLPLALRMVPNYTKGNELWFFFFKMLPL